MLYQPMRSRNSASTSLSGVHCGALSLRVIQNTIQPIGTSASIHHGSEATHAMTASSMPISVLRQ